jgi:hypothetical protein
MTFPNIRGISRERYCPMRYPKHLLQARFHRVSRTAKLLSREGKFKQLSLSIYDISDNASFQKVIVDRISLLVHDYRRSGP